MTFLLFTLFKNTISLIVLQAVLNTMDKLIPAAAAEHKFWSTQPVPQSSMWIGLEFFLHSSSFPSQYSPSCLFPLSFMHLSFIFVGEQVLEEGPIDEIKTPDMIRQEPYKLPNGFKWVDIDLYNEADVFWSLSHSNSHLGQGCVRSFVGELRRGHRLPLPLRLLCRLPQVVCFVERFRICRALCPPGYKKEYHIGVRIEKTNKLMGFITGTPQTVSVRGQPINMVDVWEGWKSDYI